MDTILSQFSSFIIHFSKHNFNTILPSPPRSSNFALPLRISPTVRQVHETFLHLLTRKILVWEYKAQRQFAHLKFGLLPPIHIHLTSLVLCFHSQVTSWTSAWSSICLFKEKTILIKHKRNMWIATNPHIILKFDDENHRQQSLGILHSDRL